MQLSFIGIKYNGEQNRQQTAQLFNLGDQVLCRYERDD